MSLGGKIGLCGILATSATLVLAQRSYSLLDIEDGSRLYRTHCISCHGSEGDTVAGVDLRREHFRRGSSDDDLRRVITRGIPGTAMPPTELANQQLFPLVAYIRSMRQFQPGAITAGDARRGQAILEGKGGCLSCHMVSGRGSRMAPDLTDIGLIRPPAYIQRSILTPSESILPQHRFIRAVTADGGEITGRRLNEDSHTLQVLDENDRLVSLSKADLREFARLTTSPMPSFEGKLSAQELADLVRYLTTLRGGVQ